MPLAFILRFLARLALLGIGGAVMRRGQVPPPWRTPGQTGQPPMSGGARWPEGIPEGGLAGALGRALARRFGTAVDVGRILVHLIALLIFMAAASTLIAAGTTLTGTARIDRVYEKQSRRGTLTFVEIVTEYLDETGELVAESRLTGVEMPEAGDG